MWKSPLKVISYYTVCSLLKQGQRLASDIFFLLVSSSSCSASVLVYFSKHLFVIARALLNSVLSLLAFFKVGKNSRMALDLKDCWFATNFFLSDPSVFLSKNLLQVCVLNIVLQVFLFD